MTMQENLSKAHDVGSARPYPKDAKWQVIVNKCRRNYEATSREISWLQYWKTVCEAGAFAEFDLAKAPKSRYSPFSQRTLIVLFGVLALLQLVDILSNLEGADIFNHTVVISFLWSAILIISTFCEQVGRVLNKWYGHFMQEFALGIEDAHADEKRDLWATRFTYWMGFFAIFLMYVVNYYYSYWFFSDKGQHPLMGVLFGVIINSGEWIVGRQIIREWKKRESA